MALLNTTFKIILLCFMVGCLPATEEKMTGNTQVMQEKSIEQSKTSMNKADSLISALNQTVQAGGDSSHPVAIPFNQAAFIQFIDARNALQNLGIAFSWSSSGYVLDRYYPQQLLDELNKLVGAAGDVNHTPEGMASTGESIVMFQNLKKTLAAYGINYHWNDSSEKYILD